MNAHTQTNQQYALTVIGSESPTYDQPGTLRKAQAVCCGLTTALLLIASPLSAQPEHAHETPPQRPQERRQERRMQEPQNTARESRPGMHWLQELRESNPALFEEAQRMRQENPDAFAQWMREQLQARRRDAILERHPALRAFLAGLPTAEREALEADLFRMAPPQRRQRDRQHDAADDPHRRSQRSDREQFDARTEYFEQELQRAEQRMEKLRELLEKRRELREALLQS